MDGARSLGPTLGSQEQRLIVEVVDRLALRLGLADAVLTDLEAFTAWLRRWADARGETALLLAAGAQRVGGAPATRV